MWPTSIPFPKLQLLSFLKRKKKNQTKEPHAQTCIGVFLWIAKFLFRFKFEDFWFCFKLHTTIPKLTPLTQFTQKKVSFSFHIIIVLFPNQPNSLMHKQKNTKQYIFPHIAFLYALLFLDPREFAPNPYSCLLAKEGAM